MKCRLDVGCQEVADIRQPLEKIEADTREDVRKVAKDYLSEGHWGYTLKPGSRRGAGR